MHILAFIILFIFGAIGAAGKGDYSGIVVIGKVLLGIGIFFVIGVILTGFSTKGAGTVFAVALVMTIIGGLMTLKEYC